ncbi:hypothetical protein [Agromyces ramosus]|uniref:Uncharacterized protein n=1 Tax=Agromyces ramosus TaxID=33879 RepID=A0ABU0R8W3_9MICO|nr:hypothetical protein [Agromyces ramosus]MDQ0894512.1 hypothetical protein [Agromyces ramosus]
MTEAQETAFWSTVAQISAVLLLTLVIEARRLAVRWSKKRFFKQRFRRWLTSVAYLSVLVSLLVSLTSGLAALINEESLSPRIVAFLLVYSSLLLILFPAMDPLLSATMDVFEVVLGPIVAVIVGGIHARGHDALDGLERRQRNARLELLMDYADAVVSRNQAERAADSDPRNRELSLTVRDAERMETATRQALDDAVPVDVDALRGEFDLMKVRVSRETFRKQMDRFVRGSLAEINDG